MDTSSLCWCMCKPPTPWGSDTVLAVIWPWTPVYDKDGVPAVRLPGAPALEAAVRSNLNAQRNVIAGNPIKSKHAIPPIVVDVVHADKSTGEGRQPRAQASNGAVRDERSEGIRAGRGARVTADGAGTAPVSRDSCMLACTSHNQVIRALGRRPHATPPLTGTPAKAGQATERRSSREPLHPRRPWAGQGNRAQ